MQPAIASDSTPHQADRAEISRANSQHSTGPRTSSGKLRSSRNALKHGLTSRAAVLPTEDRAAYELHCRQFRDEYQPQTPTEAQLVQELADTAWRLNRLPMLEADLLARALDLRIDTDPIAFHIADATRALATLSLHSQRLSRQFHKALDQLRALQSERRSRGQQHVQPLAAARQPQQTPRPPAPNGFVFSNPETDPAAAPDLTPPAFAPAPQQPLAAHAHATPLY